MFRSMLQMIILCDIFFIPHYSGLNCKAFELSYTSKYGGVVGGGC